jgi:hypothetical protein
VQIEPVSLTWDDSPIDPVGKAPAPEARQLEVLGALHRLGPLLASQIGREFFPGVSDRSVQRALARRLGAALPPARGARPRPAEVRLRA